MLFSVLVGVLLHAVGGDAEYLDPNTALAGVYTECVFKFDWPCLQRRTLIFVDRLGRAPEYPLVPGIKLVRTSEEESPPVEEMQLPVGDTDRMGDLVDEAVVKFFDEHVVRLEVPHWLADTGRSSKHHVDLFFGNRVEESREMNNENREPDSSAKGDVNDLEVPSGRMMMCSASKKCKGSKKGAKKAKKGLKKCLMAICMVMAAKMMVMAPVMMGLMKVIAIKAIVMSAMSLMMSKGMLMKKFMKGKPIMTIMKGWQSDPPASSGWDSSGGGGDMSWQPTGGGGGSGPYRRSAVRTQQLAYNNFSSAED